MLSAVPRWACMAASIPRLRAVSRWHVWWTWCAGVLVTRHCGGDWWGRQRLGGLERGADVEAVSFLEQGVEPFFAEVMLEMVSMFGVEFELDLIVGRRTLLREVVDGAVESSGDFEARPVGVSAHRETERQLAVTRRSRTARIADRGLAESDVCRGDVASHERDQSEVLDGYRARRERRRR